MLDILLTDFWKVFLKFKIFIEKSTVLCSIRCWKITKQDSTDIQYSQLSIRGICSVYSISEINFLFWFLIDAQQQITLALLFSSYAVIVKLLLIPFIIPGILFYEIWFLINKNDEFFYQYLNDIFLFDNLANCWLRDAKFLADRLLWYLKLTTKPNLPI